MPEWLKVLAVWRLSSLLVHERGPFDVLGKLRDAAGVRYDERSNCVSANELGLALCCLWCTSAWVALILARGRVWRALAYSAGAIVLQAWLEEVERG